jgi:hypothetical protein
MQSVDYTCRGLNSDGTFDLLSGIRRLRLPHSFSAAELRQLPFKLTILPTSIGRLTVG